MGLAALEHLLQTSMGLSAESIGSAAIARAVQERLTACHLDDPRAYLEHVQASGAELQALIEAVVVPETWFFRDPHAFTALGRLARYDWLPAHADGMLSVLSLPCSTGEESYSIAMALLDAGVPANRFRVDAVDISGRNLTKGRHGVYGKNSFRGHDLGFRDRYFDATAEGYRVNEATREPVHFQQGNLLAAGLLPGTGLYDVVFCRNLLIYFDRPTQDRALAVMSRLLGANGVLFVAPAESALAVSHDMTSTGEPLAFAFRKASLRVPAAKPPVAPSVKARGPMRAEIRGGAARPVARVASVTNQGIARAATLPALPSDPVAELDEATRLADQGHFAEAATRCDAHVRRWGPSATAFYLLGLVRSATGNQTEAETYYRQALYLDSNHYDALIHLALLKDEQGDAAAAQVLHNRARRLAQQRAPRE